MHWGFFAWLIGCAVSALLWSTSVFSGPLSGWTASFGDLGYLSGALGAATAYIGVYIFTGRKRFDPLVAQEVRS